MLYFKVKTEVDQKRKNPRVRNADIYIKNELYTKKEMIKQNLNFDYVEKVEVSSRQIYWSFGARFQNK